MPPILKFDRSGKLLKSWGQGMFVFPHGSTIDRDGNFWATDARGTAGKGHQVFKFSRDGKLLMTLGKAGVAGNGPDTFNQPTDVVVAPNGDIFVADGHRGSPNSRIVKFSKDGTYIKEWGKKGNGPDDISEPHDRDRLAGAPLRRRSREQPDQDLRSGRKAPRHVEAVRPAERHLHHEGRHDVRRRLRVGHERPTFRGRLQKGIRIGSARDGRS